MSPQEILLFRRWRDHRDAEAFNTLVSMYAGLVYATCQRILRNGADAEEISQECFLRLAQERDTVHTSLGGWLHQVATTRSLDRLRGNTRRRAREEIYASQVNTVAEPTWDDIQEYVDRAIETLPDGERDVIVGHFLSRKTKVELANDLNLSRRTVAKRIERGIAAIRSELDHKGITVTGILLTTFLTSHAVEAAPIALTSALGKLALTGMVQNAWLPAAGVKSGTIVGGTILMKTKLTLVAAVLVLLGIGAGLLYNDNDVTGSPPVEEPAQMATESASKTETTNSEVQTTLTSETVTSEIQTESTKFVSATTSSRPLIANPDEYVTISGFTQDQDGYPISGASVIVGPAWFNRDVDDTLYHFRTRSNEQGRFRIENINYGGTYFVFASKPGYAETWTGTEARNEIRLKAGDEINDVSLVLRKGTTLAAQVFNSNGVPVPNAVVRVTMARQGITTTLAHHAMTYTDKDGLFTLTFEESGWTSIRVHSEEHGTGTFEEIPIQDERIVELTIQETARIYGKVTMKDDAPTNGLDIRLLAVGDRAETVTDGEGRYSLEVLPNVPYRASVHLPKSYQLTDNIQLEPLQPGEEKEWNIAVATKPITVRGRIIGMPSGKTIERTIPFMDVLRYWKDGGEEKVAMNFRAVDGQYEAQLLGGAGRYQLQLRYLLNWKQGAAGPVTDVLNIEAGADVEHDLHIPEPVEVHVEVVDADGIPVEGAAIIAQTDRNGSLNARIHTNESGRLEDPLYLSPYGGYYIEARKQGFAPARGVHHVGGEPGTVHSFERLVLWPGAGIEGTVLGNDGTPWSNINLTIHLSQDGQVVSTATTTTDDRGHFTVIDKIPAAELSVELEATIGTGRRQQVIGVWSAAHILPPEAHILDLGEIKLASD